MCKQAGSLLVDRSEWKAYLSIFKSKFGKVRWWWWLLTNGYFEIHVRRVFLFDVARKLS